MADSFESVKRRAGEAAGSGAQDRSPALRRLDPRQRKALELFRASNTITSRDIASLFRISERAARNLLTAWVGDDFLAITDPAKKSRKYGLAGEYREIV
jgi:predicted HTH transcriptional regulator